MPRGRSKQPKAYGNRTDLNGPMPVTAPTGQAYGERAQQIRAQEAVPMGTPDVAAPAPMAEAMPAEVTAPMQRPQPMPLTAPTQRPEQAITEGLPQAGTTDPDVLVFKNTYLPLFRAQVNLPNTPRQFRDFVTWLENV